MLWLNMQRTIDALPLNINELALNLLHSFIFIGEEFHIAFNCFR